MDILHTIATLLPLAITSGINLYATVLIAGLCIHFGWVQNTPASLDPLDDDDITRLEARTEGWAAGLQLAALALQGTLLVFGAFTVTFAVWLLTDVVPLVQLIAWNVYTHAAAVVFCGMLTAGGRKSQTIRSNAVRASCRNRRSSSKRRYSARV